MDTTVVFDDVFVPWDQVFVYKNVELVTAQFHESPAHVQGNFQSLVRFGVKLELRILFMVPTFGVVFQPTIGPVYAF